MPALDVKRLRDELGCSIGELSKSIGVDAKTILEWESGERFPTKRHADQLEALRKAGPGAVVRRPRKQAAPSGLPLLADPRLWTIVRKLLAHPELFAEVERTADRFEDPAK